MAYSASPGDTHAREKKCLSEMGLTQGIGHGTACRGLERLNRDPEMAPQGSEIFGLATPG